MQGKTHFRVGIATGVAVAGLSWEQLDFWNMTGTVIVAGIASMVPDIDEDGSLINKALFSKLNRKHRSFALCAVGVLIVILAAFYQLPAWVTLIGVFAACVAYVPHRSVTHSLIGIAYVSYVCFLASTSFSYAILAGYISHLVMDAFTVQGIPLFWPSKQKVGLKQMGVKIKSGSIVDIVIGRVAIGIALVGYAYILYLQVGQNLALR